VILEVAEAVGLPIDELHFVVEALGDAVAASEESHGGDLFGPERESVAELDQMDQAGLTQLVHSRQEARYQLLTLPAAAMFLQQQKHSRCLKTIDGFQHRMLGQIGGLSEDA